MLTVSRALRKSVSVAAELPRLPELNDLYDKGCRFRRGELVMVAGRSGSQKSGFALWYVTQQAQRNGLSTIYFSGDMNETQASTRIACSALGLTTDEVEEMVAADPQRVDEALNGLPIDFKFGQITWWAIDQYLRAFAAIYNTFPDIICIDNLMDVEESSSEYAMQMETMNSLSELAHELNVTVFVMHHATDKGFGAEQDPNSPPKRSHIKGGMSEKPELVLTVALNPATMEYRMAVVKQRMGPSDANAREVQGRLTADPARTTFTRHIVGLGL